MKCMENLISGVQYKGEKMEVINRSFNLLAKVSKDATGAKEIADSKVLVIRTLLYFNHQFPALINNAMRVFHACCKIANFHSVCIDHHQIGLNNFDTYVAEVQALFHENYAD